QHQVSLLLALLFANILALLEMRLAEILASFPVLLFLLPDLASLAMLHRPQLARLVFLQTFGQFVESLELGLGLLCQSLAKRGDFLDQRVLGAFFDLVEFGRFLGPKLLDNFPAPGPFLLEASPLLGVFPGLGGPLALMSTGLLATFF